MQHQKGQKQNSGALTRGGAGGIQAKANALRLWRKPDEFHQHHSSQLKDSIVDVILAVLQSIFGFFSCTYFLFSFIFLLYVCYGQNNLELRSQES